MLNRIQAIQDNNLESIIDQLDFVKTLSSIFTDVTKLLPRLSHPEHFFGLAAGTAIKAHWPATTGLSPARFAFGWRASQLSVLHAVAHVNFFHFDSQLLVSDIGLLFQNLPQRLAGQRQTRDLAFQQTKILLGLAGLQLGPTGRSIGLLNLRLLIKLPKHVCLKLR